MKKSDDGKKESSTLDIDIETAWNGFYKLFKWLVLLTVVYISAFLILPDIGDWSMIFFKIAQITLGILVIIRAGKFAYLVTGMQSYRFVGLWLLFPIPLINYAILYHYMNNIKSEYSMIKKMVNDSSN